MGDRREYPPKHEAMNDFDIRMSAGMWLAGLLIGVAIGRMFDHLVLGIIIGLGLGVLASVLGQKRE